MCASMPRSHLLTIWNQANILEGMVLHMGNSCIRVNHIENSMGFYIVKREISCIRLQSIRNIGIYDSQIPLCRQRGPLDCQKYSIQTL